MGISSNIRTYLWAVYLVRYFLSLSALLHRGNRRTLSRQRVFAFANGRKYLCTASRAVQPLANATPMPESEPEQPQAGPRCLLNDKRKDISGPRRIFTFFSGVFQVKSKELKKINNSNKKEARKRCPKSGKSENENRKQKNKRKERKRKRFQWGKVWAKVAWCGGGERQRKTKCATRNDFGAPIYQVAFIFVRGRS